MLADNTTPPQTLGSSTSPTAAASARRKRKSRYPNPRSGVPTAETRAVTPTAINRRRPRTPIALTPRRALRVAAVRATTSASVGMLKYQPGHGPWQHACVPLFEGVPLLAHGGNDEGDLLVERRSLGPRNVLPRHRDLHVACCVGDAALDEVDDSGARVSSRHPVEGSGRCGRWRPASTSGNVGACGETRALGRVRR